MRILCLFFVVLFLTGCARTNNSNRSNFASWQSKSVDELTSQLGAPNNVTKAANGNIYYIYIVQQKPYIPPSSSPAVGVNVSASGKPVMIVSQQATLETMLTCIMKFEINARGLIVSKELTGDGCGM
jgi:hypothetical protein